MIYCQKRRSSFLHIVHSCLAGYSLFTVVHQSAADGSGYSILYLNRFPVTESEHHPFFSRLILCDIRIR